MLTILEPDDITEELEEFDEQKYVVLTVQPRIPAGSLMFQEIPAGMVDDGTFKGAAAQEMEEELGECLLMVAECYD
jgi:ADP-sugar diphosphatase